MIPQPLRYQDNRCNFYLLSKRCNSELKYHIKNTIKILYEDIMRVGVQLYYIHCVHERNEMKIQKRYLYYFY